MCCAREWMLKTNLIANTAPQRLTKWECKQRRHHWKMPVFPVSLFPRFSTNIKNLIQKQNDNVQKSCHCLRKPKVSCKEKTTAYPNVLFEIDLVSLTQYILNIIKIWFLILFWLSPVPPKGDAKTAWVADRYRLEIRPT